MWKKAICLTGLAGILFSVSAEPVDTVSILKAAKTFFAQGENKSISGTLKAAPVTRHLTLLKAVSNKPYFIVNSDDQGYVILSGNNQVKPILGYSDSGSFDPQNVPPALKDWLTWKENELNYILQNDIAGSDAVRMEWNNLVSGSETYATGSGVEPLLSTLWSQGTYYNDLCPSDASSDYSNKKVPVGCGATAMAQVMAYWKFPDTGTGSHSYTPSTHPEYGLQTANFGTTTYLWDAMPDYVSSASNAVATLMYHLGVSVNMNYGPDGSSTTNNSVNNAFSTYFKYKNTLSNKVKSSYTTDAWNTIIKQELDKRRPVIYRGDDNTGNSGHMFVCDGYNADNYFHINWGWSGSYNGYYSFQNLTPENMDYSYNQIAITGIEPSVSMASVSPAALNIGYSSGSNKTFNIASNVSWTATSNQSWLGVSVTSGTGCCLVTVTASTSNMSGSVRTATVTISASGIPAKTVTVTQQPYSTALPNLFSMKPSTWDDKIVVSKVKDTNTSSTGLLNSDTIYIDINVANISNYNSGAFYNTLYLDGTELMTFYFSELKANYYSSYSDIKLGRLSAGTHTLRLMCDIKNMVFETNETDNTYSRTITVGADPALGIDVADSRDLIIGPNPVHDLLTISNLNSASQNQISLTGIDGKECLIRANRDSQVVLDLSGFPAGNYILKIRTDHSVITRKIIKL